MTELNPILSFDISPKKDNAKRKEFLRILSELSSIKRRSRSRILSFSAEIYEISAQKFFDIYLNCCRSTEKIIEIGILRLKWRKKFKGNLKERVKEKVHIQYLLTHVKQEPKNEKNMSLSRGKLRKNSLLDERINDFLGKSKDFLKKANSFHENVHKINKKKRENPFWSVGTRFKSEEKMVQINNFKISRFFVNENERKKTKERPLSVNLSKVLSFDEEKQEKKHEKSKIIIEEKSKFIEEKKDFIRKQLLFKRMNIDKLFEEKKIKSEINSIFRGKNSVGQLNNPKLTSFQMYVQENKMNMKKIKSKNK